MSNGARKLFLGFWGLVLVYVFLMGNLSLKYAKKETFQPQINIPEGLKGFLGTLENQGKTTWTDGGYMLLQTNPFVNKVVVAKKQEKIEPSLSQDITQPLLPPPPPMPNQVSPPLPPGAFNLQGVNNGTAFYPPFWNATFQNATFQSQNATFSKKVLILTSIIQTEGSKVCVIDNKIYREGDEVKRHKILKIGEDYVELKGPKGKLKVKVGDTLDI